HTVGVAGGASTHGVRSGAEIFEARNPEGGENSEATAVRVERGHSERGPRVTLVRIERRNGGELGEPVHSALRRSTPRIVTRGLKEKCAIGKLIPAATGMKRYRTLDTAPTDPVAHEPYERDVLLQALEEIGQDGGSIDF